MLTEQYMKQCERAEEIQALKVPYLSEHGNFFADGAVGRGTWLISCDICFDLTKDPDRFIWLPSQAQLQEMVGIATVRQFLNWIIRLHININDTSPLLVFGQDWPVESIWLSFVMKEKYGKLWDGEGWVGN